MRKLARLLTLLATLALIATGWMYWSATRTPVVRRATIPFAQWVVDTPPLRVAFLSDIHVAGPDMPPTRLAKIVEQVNGLEPDLVLIGGDFISDKRTASRRYSVGEAIAPLAGLRSRFGTVAVFGNHDHWRDARATSSALSRAGVRLLHNNSITVGPLRIGGVDDAFTGRADVEKTVRAMRSAPGVRLMLSHSPDVAPRLPNDVTLLLAGHTHCGQIRLPLLGAVSSMSDYGDRYACGRVREGSLRVITSAGLGTSILPLRLGAPPEIWLLTLGAT